MLKIPLSLKPKLPSSENPDGDLSGPGPSDLPEGVRGIPVMGGAAIAFGILGIFTKGYVFVPLTFICSAVTLFMGNISWAFVGFLLAVAGLLTSPVLLALIGIGWLLP